MSSRAIRYETGQRKRERERRGRKVRSCSVRRRVLSRFLRAASYWPNLSATDCRRSISRLVAVREVLNLSVGLPLSGQSLSEEPASIHVRNDPLLRVEIEYTRENNSGFGCCTVSGINETDLA